MRTVVQRYPKSVYAHDARRRMVYLRNRLADFEVNVAHYYEERGAWVAAAQRARQAWSSSTTARRPCGRRCAS
ncbi:MAG: outer membrane protein assembly factor BamD [Rhodanobacteraceae bacterium]|nr:outer membrane protein assembly factor BamD [Rhodanobacteraceae bacterium]